MNPVRSHGPARRASVDMRGWMLRVGWAKNAEKQGQTSLRPSRHLELRRGRLGVNTILRSAQHSNVLLGDVHSATTLASGGRVRGRVVVPDKRAQRVEYQGLYMGRSNCR